MYADRAYAVDFEASQRYLLSLGNEVETMKLGLHNISELLRALENPQNNYKKVQIAGTNGKGSVCAFLNSICVEAGIRTGLYTSPHLVSVKERIKIDGADMSPNDFARYTSQIRETAEKLIANGVLENLPTFFEQITAIALLAFSDAEVELAILETGLGGRYDATTAANAEIAAITRIDLDHQEYLGNTIEQIAAEKAAIIRKDSAVIVGEQMPEAMAIIELVCSSVGVSPMLAQDVSLHELGFPPKRLGLAGRHQVENAKIAVAVTKKLRNDYQILESHIVKGLHNARHPGRLEFIGNVLLDGAHNRAGASALADYLDEFVHQPITLVFGAMKDKAVAEIIGILAPRAEKIFLTKSNNLRAMEPSEIKKFIPAEFDREKVAITGSVAEALAIDKSIFRDGLMLVTGSLYLVGEVKAILEAER